MHDMFFVLVSCLGHIHTTILTFSSLGVLDFRGGRLVGFLLRCPAETDYDQGILFAAWIGRALLHDAR